ncbi:hypothetical protein SK128_006183 [Halocaridina rubra]|uniref:Uncharacterized protein n=1 Tax=Halocaridina rubra TaxID=373956 RepID=A0AAN8XNA7_HALRR
MGSKANASTGVEKALSSHIGPKIRHTTKISRKQLKKQKQDRAKGGVKRLRVFGTNNAPVAKKLKSGDLGDAAADKKKKSKKVLPKTFRSELKQDKQFKEMVEKYKKKMALSSHVPTKKWYED